MDAKNLNLKADVLKGERLAAWLRGVYDGDYHGTAGQFSFIRDCLSLAASEIERLCAEREGAYEALVDDSVKMSSTMREHYRRDAAALDEMSTWFFREHGGIHLCKERFKYPGDLFDEAIRLIERTGRRLGGP